MNVKLSEGNGGKEMNILIDEFKKLMNINLNGWENNFDDSATFNLGDKYLFFTTDSYTVDPLFFNGGNIGDLAINGTINDIAVQGGNPLGISLSVVIEEGFSKNDLFKIIGTIGRISKTLNVPVVTGDTKVLNKGSVDKIIITTSAVGLSSSKIDDDVEEGDVIIVSGSVGDHGAVILAHRNGFETDLISDTKAVYSELKEINGFIKKAKDITRGGLASALNDIAKRSDKGILIFEDKIPVKDQVLSITKVLGVDPYSLASEGKFVCVVSKDKSDLVLNKLRKYDSTASIIGHVNSEIENGDVALQTKYGRRLMPEPIGNIVPRIC